MKKLSILLFAGAMLLLGLSCGSTQGAAGAGSDRPVYENFNSLADALRLQGGLQVVGSGSNAQVYIRGISTFKLNTQPLYIIDGTRLGNDYSIANASVNVKNIESIRVIKSKSDLTTYGEEGTNGVIIINTKSSVN